MSTRLTPATWRGHVEFPDIRPLVDRVLSHRPLLLVTGHFGNWEIGGYVLGLLGFRTWAIARKLDNDYLDDFLRLAPPAKFGGADISIIVEYQPWLVPLRQEKEFRFATELGTDSRLYWASRPADE